jgi:2-polyprenyl-6-methoxyphenol hydroxylase-like FAD-dependent oxidoreductase
MLSVNSVIIAGGGSAGWLTALVLNTYCPFLKIQLIRPRENSPIGVGESTQTDFMQLLKAAGIDIAEFYRECGATVKCGIFYRDWNEMGDHYWHPFSDLATTGSYTAAHYYQQMILRDPANFSHKQYYKAVHTSYDCIISNKIAPEAAVALHVDAVKITGYFESKLKRVEVIEADSIDVRTEAGRVASLVLDGTRTVSADLYVDCTGFSKALYRHVATPEVLHYEANVNRAVAAQLPYVDVKQELTPYTLALAHDQGWTWAIPLQSRIGTGYVYHSDFCSADQAETNFRKYWGEARMSDIPVKHIAFDSVSLRNPWAQNVVAIGLCAGFVEPLEATGLNWTITSADLLSQSIAARYFDQDTSIKYNANIRGYIRDVQDFVDAHYKLSARRDSEFWRYQTSRTFPERLNQRLALYAEDMPNDANRLKTSPWAFNEVSWLDILNGYNFRYRQLNIGSTQENMAKKILEEISRAPRRCVDPSSWA